jgi:hypothetical protein
MRELVVLGWCKYGEDVPPLQFVKNRRSLINAGAQEKSADEVKWGELLDRYGLRYISDTSEVVLKGLEQGFFDELVVLPAAQKLNDMYIARQSESDFHEAWQIYHRGFGDDEKELVDTLCASFRKNVHHISPGNANGTVMLLKCLGYTALASDLINLYVASRDAATFDRRQMFSENDISDEEFNAAVKTKIAEVVDGRDPGDVLLTISSNQGWDGRDILLLSKIDADGYVKLFKSIKDSDELSACIRMALRFGKMGGVGDAEKVLAQNATEALIKIGNESALNKLRVDKYGIKID